MNIVLPYAGLLAKIQASIPAGIPLHLTGGAVRDMLVGRASHDLDFLVPDNALKLSQKVARDIGAAFYALDAERDTGRLILKQPDGERMILDFSPYRGEDLQSDLHARDFTINAVAMDLRTERELVDPLHGAQDLINRKLRACSTTSLLDDPVRILRGVRLAFDFKLKILPDTSTLMRQAGPQLERISAERVCEELFKILNGAHPAAAIRLLDMLGALQIVLPELPPLKGIDQPPPHVADVWEHTLDAVNRLDDILQVLAPEYDPDKAASLALGMAALQLGRFRQALTVHINDWLNPDRSIRALMILAVLYHDVGKLETRQVASDGRLRFLEHENVSALAANLRAHQLRLSNEEIHRLVTVVRNHMRPLLLTQTGLAPSRRAIYRFFRQTGRAGVDICLLSLADMLATYGTSLPQDLWARHLEVVQHLFEAWWERPEESVKPPLLLNGHDLIQQFGLSPGIQIGQLLEAVREAQATGRVSNHAQAVALVDELLKKQDQEEENTNLV